MKKLIVLLVLALSAPAMAAYIGAGNPLSVDIDGGGVTTTKAGWQQWMFQSNWTGPANQAFNNPLAEQPWEIPGGQLDVFRLQGTPTSAGASRNRGGGMAFVAGTGDFAITSQGFGMSYIKLTLTQLEPDVAYKISLWAYEQPGVWNNGTDEPAKYVQWATVNPNQWLTDNYNATSGECPLGGYGPIPGSADSNMPAGLKALVQDSGRNSLSSPIVNGYDQLGWNANKGDVRVTADGDGTIVLYGWMDGVKVWGGSNHVPLYGFYVVPEPTTMALLGFGGLALIRRKRA
jgi:hypothetical protein